MHGAREPLLGRYELCEERGRGAMGVVWRARDRELDHEVALKFLPPELAEDLRRATCCVPKPTQRSV